MTPSALPVLAPPPLEPKTTPPLDELVVRRAGVPLAALDRLEAERAAALTNEALELEAWCATHRDRLCDEILYHQIGGNDDKRLRRAWIALKRAVFNDRPPKAKTVRRLEPHVDSLRDEDAALVRGWLERMARRVAIEESGDEALESDDRALSRRLREDADDPEFLKGLLMASVELFDETIGLVDPKKTFSSRRRRKTELSLVQYLARAAAKTSPFSFFTATGLTSAGAEAAAAAPPIRSAASFNQSLFRHLAERIAAHPALRPSMPVRVNRHYQDRDGVRLLFLRGRGDATPYKFIDHHEQTVRVPITDGLKTLCAAIEASGAVPHDQLVDQLTRSPDQRDAAVATVEGLVAKGLLHCGFVMPAQECRPAAWLARRLRALPAAEAAEIARALEQLDATLDDFLDGDVESRRVAVGALDRRLRRLFDAVDEPWDEGWRNQIVYEDCVLDAPSPAPGDRYAEAARDLTSVYRLAPLYDHNFAHRETIKHFLETTHGDARVDLLQLFVGYVDFVRSTPFVPDGDILAYNPYGLEVIDRAAALRREITASLARRLVTADDELELGADWIDSFAERIPDAARIDMWLQAFCQPVANADGGHGLVLNEVFDGFRRLRLRHDGQRRQRGASTESSLPVLDRLPDDHRGAAEIVATFGLNANFHAPITRRVIDYGAVTPDPRDGDGGVIGLGEITVELSPTRRLVVRDGAGVEILPLDLGLMAPMLQPPLYRFLTQLGTSRVSTFRPLGMVDDALPLDALDEPRVYPRVVHGAAVLARRTWRVPQARLPIREPGLSDFGYLLEVRRWARALGLPDEVFVRAKTLSEQIREAAAAGRSIQPYQGDSARKPQLLRFDSHILVKIFERSLEQVGRSLVVEEALPSRDDWRRADTRHAHEWILELHLDGL